MQQNMKEQFGISLFGMFGIPCIIHHTETFCLLQSLLSFI